jgi:kynureninase
MPRVPLVISTLAQVRSWDADDPLRSLRRRFALPPTVIYLDGNSLGPPPREAKRRIGRVIAEEWGGGLIRSWNDAGWIGAPARVGGKIARLIGAAPGEVIVADSTSVNLFKLLTAALAERPGRRVILTATGDFPTDLYLARGVASILPKVEVRAVADDDLEASLDGDVAVLLVSHVHYKTAARRDMAALTRRAHDVGALTLWDLSHSAGAIAVDVRSSGVDLAVGCGYKFLNGGPGAPAYLFVAERLQRRLRSPLSGWMGHAAPFDFSDDYEPADGIARFQCGTPPVLGLLALEVGVDLWLDVDLSALAQKAQRQWALLAESVEERCAGHGFVLITPCEPGLRGSHIAFRHAEAFQIVQAIIARGVIGDFRAPDIVRLAITPLYLSYEDVWRAGRTLYEVMQSGAWRGAPGRIAGAVT